MWVDLSYSTIEKFWLPNGFVAILATPIEFRWQPFSKDKIVSLIGCFYSLFCIQEFAFIAIELIAGSQRNIMNDISIVLSLSSFWHLSASFVNKPTFKCSKFLVPESLVFLKLCLSVPCCYFLCVRIANKQWKSINNGH